MTKTVPNLMKIINPERPKKPKHRNIKITTRQSIIKLSKTNDKEKKILNHQKNKRHFMYKVTKTKKNFLMETKRQWNNIFQVLKERKKNFPSRIL